MRNKILIFGDSITYGQKDLELGGWTNRLKLVLANDSSGLSCHVFNMGVPGQTTGEVLERLERECRGRVPKGTNIIIILAAGINDNTARQIAGSVMYVGLTPVDESRTNPVKWDKNKNWKNEVVENYDTIIRRVCEEKGVRYLYMFDRIDPLTNQDGLHPSAEGHRIMTGIIAGAVYECLKR